MSESDGCIATVVHHTSSYAILFESPCIASFLEAVLGPLPLQAMVHRKRAKVPNIGIQERIKKNKPWKFVQVAVAKQVRSGKA